MLKTHPGEEGAPSTNGARKTGCPDKKYISTTLPKD